MPEPTTPVGPAGSPGGWGGSRLPDTHHTDVLVVGAGPAGLTLACELALAGVAVTVLERHPVPPDFCRGFNLNARSLELLDRRRVVRPGRRR